MLWPDERWPRTSLDLVVGPDRALALLESRGEPVAGLELPIYVPVSLRDGRRGEPSGNLITQMVIRLPVGRAGPVLLALIVRRRVNLGSADLPGPQQRLSFAGAELLEVFPLLNLVGNVSLGVGAMSYVDRLNVMVVADGDGYPDLDRFTGAARSELRALADPAVDHPRGVRP